MAIILNQRENILDQSSTRFNRPSKNINQAAAPWTNLWTTPSDIINWNGTYSKTSTNEVLSPDSGNSIKVVPTNSSGSVSLVFNSDNVGTSMAAGQAYPVQTSIYVRGTNNATNRYGILIFLQAVGPVINSEIYLAFDPYTGVLSNVINGANPSFWSSTSATKEQVGNLWWKVTLKGTLTQGNSLAAVRNITYFTINGSGSLPPANSIDGLYLYGPNIYFGQQPDEKIGDVWVDSTNIFRRWNGHTFITTSTASAITASLTADSVTIPSDSNGNVTSYTGSGTQIYVYEGTTILQYRVPGTTNGTWTVSAVGTGITPGAITDGGQDAIVGVHSAATQDVSSVKYTITGRTSTGNVFSIDKVQTITKSRNGANGAAGPQGPTGPQGPAGANGLNGTRGTIQVSRSVSGSSWSDSEANTAVSNNGSGSPITGDIVTLFNSSTAFSETRVRSSGGTWSPLTAFFGGNVLVDKTLFASKIASDAVEARHIKVTGGGAALNPDPLFTDPSNEETWRPVDVSSASKSVVSITDGPAGTFAMRSIINPGGVMSIKSKTFPISRGKTYRVSVWINRRSGTGGSLYLRLYRYTSSGVLQSYALNDQIGNGYIGQLEGVPLVTGWTRYSGSIEITDPTVTLAEVVCYTGYLPSTTTTVDIQDLRCEEMADANLIVDGAVRARHVSSDSISARHMSIGSFGDNLVPDANLRDPQSWTFSGPGSVAFANVADAPGGRAMYITNYEEVYSKYIPIDIAKNYLLSLYYAASPGAPQYLFVAFADNNFNNIEGAGSSATGWPSYGTFFYFGLVGGTGSSSWTRYSISFGPGEEAKIPSNARYVRIGALGNYQNSSGTQSLLAMPILQEKVTGELTVRGTLSVTDSNGNVLFGVGTNNNTSLANLLGFNGSFSDWTSTLPTGWSLWSGAVPIKETGSVKPPGATYGLKFICTGADQGINRTVFFPAPRPANTLIRGSFSFFMQGNVGGGPSGLLIDLFTNDTSGNTYNGITVLANTTVSGWQRVPFEVGSGNSVCTGIRIYVMSSYSGFPGGNAAAGNTMVFGPIEFDIQNAITSSNVTTFIADAAITSAKIESVQANKVIASSLSAITATIGTLRTATSGARTEIKDNLIEVYDSSNSLRVRMGVW